MSILAPILMQETLADEVSEEEAYDENSIICTDPTNFLRKLATLIDGHFTVDPEKVIDAEELINTYS